MFLYDEMIKKNMYVYFTWLEIVGDIILRNYEPIFWPKILSKHNVRNICCQSNK